MNRPTLLSLHTLAIAVAALLLTLSLSGCGTVLHSLPDDAIAGIVPSGRGAP